MPTLSLSQYPDVPGAPGVPQVLRDPYGLNPGGAAAAYDAQGNSVTDFSAEQDDDGGDLAADAPQEQWGIYDQSGALALQPDAIVGYDYRNEARVADYPLEGGAFASYNKVAAPFDFRFTLAYASDASGRKAFLDALDGLLASTDLYNIVTPEGVWENVTIDNCDYRREARSGVQMLTVNVYARQVRIVGGDSYTCQPSAPDQTQGGPTAQTQQNTASAPLEPTHTQSPDASDLKNQGRVQAAPPTPSQDCATNYASASANDGLNAAASGGDVAAWKIGSQTVGDMLGNPPAPLSPANQSAYSSTINTLSGGATGYW